MPKRLLSNGVQRQNICHDRNNGKMVVILLMHCRNKHYIFVIVYFILAPTKCLDIVAYINFDGL